MFTRVTKYCEGLWLDRYENWRTQTTHYITFGIGIPCAFSLHLGSESRKHLFAVSVTDVNRPNGRFCSRVVLAVRLNSGAHIIYCNATSKG